MKVAVLGGGVIGGGWAARFLLNGHDVALFDPADDAEARVAAVLSNARRALPALYDVAMPPEGRLTMAATAEAAVEDAAWIQESVPERLELKHRVFSALADRVPRDAVVASSTSGFKPSDLQVGAGPLAPQILVAHPFQPVYLLPLVEIVPSPATDPAITERAIGILEALGMAPLRVRREIDAHIADRLLEAVWREALWLVHDDIATTEEIDEAIRLGFGLRWAQMGLFETYRIAGGDAGIRHFLAQFGPALEWPWTKLTDTPPFTPELVEMIATQSDAQSGARSIRELERQRDDALVAFLRALATLDHAAGAWLRTHGERLTPSAGGASGGADVTVRRHLPATWADASGAVPSARVAELFGQGANALLQGLGPSPHGFATLETSVRHLGRIQAGTPVSVTSQVLSTDTGKVHLFHQLRSPEGTLLATGEQVVAHTGSPGPTLAALQALAERHASLEPPDDLRLSI